METRIAHILFMARVAGYKNANVSIGMCGADFAVSLLDSKGNIIDVAYAEKLTKSLASLDSAITRLATAATSN
jgi:hypothetical protein